MSDLGDLENHCRHGKANYLQCEQCWDLHRAGSDPLHGFHGNRWIHELKILPEFFEAVLGGLKTFEIRRNDRLYQVGDVLRLKEWNGEDFTGRHTLKQVTYLSDYEQKPGFVVLGLGLWLAFKRRT